MVTGASDGIGFGFCSILAQLGFNIVLISRNSEKLNEAVERLKQMQATKSVKSQFKIITFDFKDSSKKELVDRMVADIEGLDICFLVNNVGVNSVQPHLNLSHDQITDITNINCTSMVVLTAKLIHRMSTRGKRSGIINVSSLAGENATPFMSLYSASKSFTNKFSEGLGMEYSGIDVLSLRPLIVANKLLGMRRNDWVPDGA